MRKSAIPRTTRCWFFFGKMTNSADELGHATTMVYDEFKRVVSVTDALNRTTTYSYDLPGGGPGSCDGFSWQ